MQPPIRNLKHLLQWDIANITELEKIAQLCVHVISSEKVKISKTWLENQTNQLIYDDPLWVRLPTSGTTRHRCSSVPLLAKPYCPLWEHDSVIEQRLTAWLPSSIGTVSERGFYGIKGEEFGVCNSDWFMIISWMLRTIADRGMVFVHTYGVSVACDLHTFTNSPLTLYCFIAKG